MSTMTAKPWKSGQEIGNMRWNLGYRTHRFGEYLLTMGDRLCGDKPHNVSELFDAGREHERRITARATAHAEILTIYGQLDGDRKELLADEARRLIAAQD